LGSESIDNVLRTSRRVQDAQGYRNWQAVVWI